MWFPETGAPLATQPLVHSKEAACNQVSIPLVQQESTSIEKLGCLPSLQTEGTYISTANLSTAHPVGFRSADCVAEYAAKYAVISPAQAKDFALMRRGYECEESDDDYVPLYDTEQRRLEDDMMRFGCKTKKWNKQRIATFQIVASFAVLSNFYLQMNWNRWCYRHMNSPTITESIKIFRQGAPHLKSEATGNVRLCETSPID